MAYVLVSAKLRFALRKGRRLNTLQDEARNKEDIRLLGRILGDVIRDQEGAHVYALVEKIRGLSVTVRRAL